VRSRGLAAQLPHGLSLGQALVGFASAAGNRQPLRSSSRVACTSRRPTRACRNFDLFSKPTCTQGQTIDTLARFGPTTLARPPWPDPGPTLARPWLDLGSTLAQGFGTSAMDKRVGSGESSAPPHAGRDAATPERACHRGDPPASVQRAHPAEGLGVNLAKRLYLTHPAGAPAMNCAHHEHFVDLKKDRPISPGPISPGPISPGPISSGPISSGPISSGLGTVRPVITSGRFRSTKSQRRAYCNSSCIRPSLVFSMPCCSRKGAAVTNRRRARSPEAR